MSDIFSSLSIKSLSYDITNLRSSFNFKLIRIYYNKDLDLNKRSYIKVEDFQSLLK